MSERTTKDTATPCIFANKKPVSSSFWVQLHVANPLSEVITWNHTSFGPYLLCSRSNSNGDWHPVVFVFSCKWPKYRKQFHKTFGLTTTWGCLSAHTSDEQQLCLIVINVKLFCFCSWTLVTWYQLEGKWCLVTNHNALRSRGESRLCELFIINCSWQEYCQILSAPCCHVMSFFLFPSGIELEILDLKFCKFELTWLWIMDAGYKCNGVIAYKSTMLSESFGPEQMSTGAHWDSSNDSGTCRFLQKSPLNCSFMN